MVIIKILTCLIVIVAVSKAGEPSSATVHPPSSAVQEPVYSGKTIGENKGSESFNWLSVFIPLIKAAGERRAEKIRNFVDKKIIPLVMEAVEHFAAENEKKCKNTQRDIDDFSRDDSEELADDDTDTRRTLGLKKLFSGGISGSLKLEKKHEAEISPSLTGNQDLSLSLSEKLKYEAEISTLKKQMELLMAQKNTEQAAGSSSSIKFDHQSGGSVGSTQHGPNFSMQQQQQQHQSSHNFMQSKVKHSQQGAVNGHGSLNMDMEQFQKMKASICSS